MSQAQIPEHPGLADLPRISNARIVVGKNVCSGGEADLIERLGACLGKDNGIGLTNGVAYGRIQRPVPEDDLPVRIKAWVK